MSLTTSSSKMAMAKTVISTVGSVAAAAMVVRSIAHDYLPHEIRDFLSVRLHNIFNRFSTQMTIVIDEYNDLTKNEIYQAAAIYLGTKTSPKTRRLKATKPNKESNISLAMERNEEVIESYNGVKFRWGWVCHQTQHEASRFSPYKMGESAGSEYRYFLLTFHKKHQEMAVKSYLPYILHEAESIKQESKTLKIFTVERSRFSNMKNTWKPVVLDHPSTFDTLAMDSGLKEMVLKDLERFVKRKEKYRNVGKAWKRGYLLYGPPGTGKSSLIAAMANYLKFDIYDLELTEVTRNSDLRKLLISTANRSILVVEDIDCTIELQDRMTKSRASWQPVGFYGQEESKVTLSGFLNFIDGLWSSCGDERIIIFTTNHKEKLDPALLRPGRMDMHIHMSYCTPCGLKILADNYLGVNGGSHRLFGEIEELISTIEVTPAEVAEQLLKSDEPDVSFSGLVDFLHARRRENEDAKAKKLNETNLVAKEKENGQDDDGFSEKTNGLTSESMK